MNLRKIDKLIAEHITKIDLASKDCGGMLWSSRIPKYSSDIRAAWQVVEILKDPEFDLSWHPDSANIYTKHVWTADFGGLDEKDLIYADTASLAICLAALKTKGVNHESFIL